MTTPQRSNTVVIMGCGDVGPVIEPVDSFIEPALPILRQADLRFAQCERLYSERGSLQLAGGTYHCRVHPRLASIFKAGGFDVVSLASNHAMDWGEEAHFDTADRLRGLDIQICGAGRNIEEARRPAIFQCNGIKVAFLAYCSVLRRGCAAGPSKAGVAPMEAHTYYESQDWWVGTPPKVVTIPYEDQLSALQEDISKAKEQNNVVVMSIHWGIPFMPKTIAMFQPKVAHAAIDAGADLILGHHPHILKAVEVYKGKVCFYSLGNFIMSRYGKGGPSPTLQALGIEVNPDYGKHPEYDYSRDSRYTGVAKAVLSPGGVERVSFLPAYLNPDFQPEILSRENERFNEVLNYLEWVSDEFPHHFRVDGNEVIIEGTA